MKVFCHSGPETFFPPLVYIKQNQFLQQVSLILHGEKSGGRRKNETEIIIRAKAEARITTRTGEIPLLIPNLSGCCHFFAGVYMYTWLFTHIFPASKNEGRMSSSGVNK